MSEAIRDSFIKYIRYLCLLCQITHIVAQNTTEAATDLQRALVHYR